MAKKKKKSVIQRELDSFDMEWSFRFARAVHRLYVLKDGEWFDPNTSTKYVGGISAHAMWGPGVVISRDLEGGRSTTLYDVGDPEPFRLIGRMVRAGADFKFGLGMGHASTGGR